MSKNHTDLAALAADIPAFLALLEQWGAANTAAAGTDAKTVASAITRRFILGGKMTALAARHKLSREDFSRVAVRATELALS